VSALQSQTIDVAHRLFEKHELVNFSFGFDRAVRRAGQCDFRARRITISKHLVANCSLDEIEQVILHEIAHALVGKDAGHSKIWRDKAKAIGYRFEKVNWQQMAASVSGYLGTCPGGHDHFRIRKQSGPRSCRSCAGTFDPRHLITWRLTGPDQQGHDPGSSQKVQ